MTDEYGYDREGILAGLRYVRKFMAEDLADAKYRIERHQARGHELFEELTEVRKALAEMDAKIAELEAEGDD